MTAEPTPADAPSSKHTTPLAIGYLHASVSTNPGFDAARLRLTALAHGYTLSRVLTATTPSHLTLLLLAIDYDQAAAVLTPHLGHLPGNEADTVRNLCDLLAGNTPLPRINNPGKTAETTHPATDPEH
ncbi:hypothetical protein B0T36_22940 [Nocardia donostiensis]|uniref:hypothetical protein n=1 Tax=Nocardia donostiensis TaxID=1538463 RepID=UPI0009DAEB97|nr:hypothetical protein [Nocardia donostiensis]OQS12821.1 hypothetical protein B0T36_22940 [Nocardia donostiensis]